SVVGENANVHAVGLHRRAGGDGPALVVAERDLDLAVVLLARLDGDALVVAAQYDPGERQGLLVDVHAACSADDPAGLELTAAPDSGNLAERVVMPFAGARRVEEVTAVDRLVLLDDLELDQRRDGLQRDVVRQLDHSQSIDIASLEDARMRLAGQVVLGV